MLNAEHVHDEEKRKAVDEAQLEPRPGRRRPLRAARQRRPDVRDRLIGRRRLEPATSRLGASRLTGKVAGSF